MKNLTSGPIQKQLITLAVPLIIGNILQQLYNTIDALVIGRYAGAAAFAAIGVAGTIMNLFVFIISGCCTGISVILAHFYGCGDIRGFGRETFTALLFGGLFTGGISLLGITLLKPLLILIRTPGDVAALTGSYLFIIFAGMFATFLYNFCSAALRAVGNTSAALIFLAIAAGTNLVLDLVFVAVLHQGISGAACATVLSQILSVILCFFYMKANFPVLMLHRDDICLDRSLLKKTCRYGLVTAMHQSNLYIGKLLVQASVNSMGTEMIAAYTAATRLEGFANSFGDSGNAALSVFIAQNAGNQSGERIRQGFAAGCFLLTALGLVSSAAMYLSSHSAAAFMLGTGSGSSYLQASSYMRTIAFFYPLCFIGNAFVGYFEGTGRMGIPVLGATCHITLRVLLSWLFIGKFGLAAVAGATGLGWLFVVLLWAGIFLYSRQTPARRESLMK